MRTKFIDSDTVSKVAQNIKDKKIRTIWLLMNDTGLRVSDAVGIRYSDIDSKGQIHYKSKKTGKNGIAKPSPNILALLGRQPIRSMYVFSSNKNPAKHIHRSTVFKAIKKACSDAGIDSEGIAPHSASKAFAVNDFRQYGLGKTMHDLQHSSAATTLFYALSDDPIPQIFAQLKVLKQCINFNYEKIEDLFEICDRILEKIVDVDEPLKLKVSDQKKAGE